MRATSSSTLTKLRDGARLWVRQRAGLVEAAVVSADGAWCPDVPVTEVLAVLRAEGVREVLAVDGWRRFEAERPSAPPVWLAEEPPRKRARPRQTPTFCGRPCVLRWGARLKQKDVAAALGYKAPALPDWARPALEREGALATPVSPANPKKGLVYVVDDSLVRALRALGAEVVVEEALPHTDD